MGILQLTGVFIIDCTASCVVTVTISLDYQAVIKLMVLNNLGYILTDDMLLK